VIILGTAQKQDSGSALGSDFTPEKCLSNDSTLLEIGFYPDVSFIAVTDRTTGR